MVDVFKGKYHIVREIARSNDIVYEAQDTSLGRRIALKELNIGQGLTGQARRDRIERFSREARSAGRLSHPNIVSIFDFGEDNGRHFIAMEYLEGQNLRERLMTKGALPLTEAIDIACQILDAIAFAHRNGIIHRDIKPDNIHILPGGQVKLTDFGIARLTEEPSLTSDGQIFGTPSYMSPEQIIGKSIDYRSDLFSLGIVLYEILTARKPFVGDNVVSITYAIMNQETPPMPGVPKDIDRIVRRALSKNSLQRYANAEEMKIELRNADLMPAAYGMSGSLYPPSLPPMPSMGSGSLAPPASSVPVVFQNLPPVPTAAPPQSLAHPPANQPWAWNNGASLPPQPTDPNAQPAMTQMQNAPNWQAKSRYINPPSQPLVLLSPEAKRWLSILGLALLFGGALGGMVVAFFRSYDTYQLNTSAQTVVELMNRGKAAYDTGDYSAALGYFEKASNADKGHSQKDRIYYSLTATNIQLGHKEKDRRNWERAKVYYDSALKNAPDSLVDIARNARAFVLEQMGNHAEAQNDRSSVENQNGETQPPNMLPAESPSANKNKDVYKDFRVEAQKLIREGDDLYNTGNIADARSRWIEAMGTASGDTPEHAEAQDRLEKTRKTGRF